MTRFLLILAILAVVALIVLRLKRGAARPRANFGRGEVESALLNVLTIDATTHDEWDYFLSHPLDDPHLESIRQRCIDICKRYPGGGDRDLPEPAVTEVRALLEELRTRAPVSGGGSR